MHYLLCGGSCSGKSTFSKMLSARLNLPVYHADEHIDGDHSGKFLEHRHPVNYRIRNEGIYWLFDLSKEGYVKTCVESANEDLEFVKEDIEKADNDFIIEGLWAGPSLVNSLFPNAKVIWLFPTRNHQMHVWAGRQWTRDILSEHKNPDSDLSSWIEGDYALSLYLQQKAAGIPNPVYILNTGITGEENFLNVSALLDLQRITEQEIEVL